MTLLNQRYKITVTIGRNQKKNIKEKVEEEDQAHKKGKEKG